MSNNCCGIKKDNFYKMYNDMAWEEKTQVEYKYQKCVQYTLEYVYSSYIPLLTTVQRVQQDINTSVL